MVGSWDSDSHASVRRGPRPRAGRQVTVLLGISGLLLLQGCGGDDGQEGSDRGSSETTEARSTDPEPPASEAEAVRPYIVSLLEEHDHVVNQILADPSVASDRENELTQRYVDLFAPDSDVPEQILESWVHMADVGQRTEPYEPGQSVNDMRLTGDVEAMADDQARFPLCHELGYRTVDGDNQVIEDRPPQEHPGEGFAARVRGEWLLWRIDVDVETVGCTNAGGS